MSSTRAYAAERDAWKGKFRGRDVGISLAEAEELIHRYVGSTWEVRRTRSNDFGSGSSCYTESRRIMLSADAGLPLVLHELAHALAYLDHNRHGHGLPWQRSYVDLVKKEIGEREAARLRNKFIQHHVAGWKTWLREKGK